MEITKSFELTAGQSVSLRLDLLNAFNYYNYSDTLRNWGSGGVANPNPVTYNPTGNISGVPRTLRVRLDYKF